MNNDEISIKYKIDKNQNRVKYLVVILFIIIIIIVR